MNDVEHERDDVVSFTWVHALAPGILFATSPFFHSNLADYNGDPNDIPISTTQHRDPNYAGAQATVAAVGKKHNLVARVYGFGQHDNEFVGLIANDGSGDSVRQTSISAGQLETLFFEDQYKATSWLTLIGGLRLTHFAGSISENADNTRLGGSVRIPYLHWVLRGFWGTYYRAPPLAPVGRCSRMRSSKAWDSFPCAANEIRSTSLA